MAKTRRTFTDEDKQKIVAHSLKHGLQVAAGHFNIVDSVIRRWQREAGEGPKPKKLRQWTPEKVKGVLAYFNKHGYSATLNHFKISAFMLHNWRTNKRPKTNGISNGLGELPYQDALMWLGRWRQAYFDQLKAETPSAESVLDALRGGK